MRKIVSFLMLLIGTMWLSQPVKAAEILIQDKDMKSGVGYTVVSDDQSLVIAFDFSGPIRLMQMTRNGFGVYANPRGKKKTEIGLLVEGVRPPRPTHPGTPFGENTNGMMSPDSMPKPEIGEIKFANAKWVEGNDTTEIQLNQPDSPFRVYLDQTDGKNRCVVVLPLGLLDREGKLNPRNLMIGLVSDPTSNDKSGKRPTDKIEDPRNGNRSEGDRPGPPPGGFGGRGGAPGGGPGRRPEGGEPRMRGQFAESGMPDVNKIEVWFKCK